MNKHALAPFLFGALLIASAAGCAGPVAGGEGSRDSADTTAGKTAGAEPSPTPAPAGDTPAGTANQPGAAVNQPAATAAKSGAAAAPQAKMPEPQVGSGGNDLFLFTRVRAAVAGAGELQGSGIVLNVSDGVVVLSGTVPDEALKAKAAEVVRGVEGVKGVRNELRVAKGGAAR
jgi:hyperosmotically inducible periplasmic protein